ncbi:MAG: nucleotide exchange factor GrpE [Oscillospiraceae bacterium]|nr:nucleotide exchange factor GrpE [Oscillospiraceae bacterium]
MTEDEKTTKAEETTEAPQTETQEAAPEEPDKKKKGKKPDKHEEALEALRKQLAAEKDNYLRLAAEYDNYRKRSLKEKDHIYEDGKADTLQKLLPVYDNLERALQHETEDEAYKKGVEMTMAGFQEILKKCGVELFGEKGELFDPGKHNAVMHVEDDSLGENVIQDVFQKGFQLGDKVVRCAMVKVAN